MKRIICFLLIGMTLLSGCSPVISNNSLELTLYEAPSYLTVTKAFEEETIELRELDYESYSIDGTDAFYFLPYHGNSPNDVYSFCLLDYTADGYFVYGYLAAYYGDAALIALADEDGADATTGMTVTSSKGTAPKAVEWSDETLNSAISAALVAETNEGLETATYSEEATHLVATYMSFNPDTRDYHIFHTELDSLDLITSEISSTLTGLTDGSSFATVENGMVGEKLTGKDEYLFCFQNRGYVYDISGELVFYADYMEMVVSELAAQNISTTSKDVEVVDFVMDGSYVAYASVILSDESAFDSDDDEEYDEDADDGVGYYLLSGYYLPLADDPDDVGFVFSASNVNAATQEELFLSMDGTHYSSLGAYNTALAANNAQLAKYPDVYEPYNSFNMVLVGVQTSNVNSLGYSVVSSALSKSSPTINFANMGWWSSYIMNGWQDYGSTLTDYILGIRWSLYSVNNYEQDHLWDWLCANASRARRLAGGYSYNSSYYSDSSTPYYYHDDHNLISPYSSYMGAALYEYYATNKMGYIKQLVPTQSGYSYGNYGVSYGASSYLFGIDVRETSDYGAVTSNTLKYQGLTMPDGVTGAHSDYFTEVVYNEVTQNFIPVANAEQVYTRTITYDYEQVDTSSKISTDTVASTADESKAGASTSTSSTTTKNADTGASTETTTEVKTSFATSDSGTTKSTTTTVTTKVTTPMVQTITQSLTTGPKEVYLDTDDAALGDGKITFSAMDLLTTSNYALPASDLGVYYYGPNSNNDNSTISYTDGNGTKRLNDTAVSGEAASAQLYAEIGTAETVAVLTDTGVQFYYRKDVNSNYGKKAFVELESFTPNSANVFTYMGDTLTEAEASTYGGASSGFYDLNQISQLTENEMLISTLTDGMVLYIIEDDLFVAVEDGGFFRSFEIEGGTSHMVVGFDTMDYSYNTTDLVWAKCYEMELSTSAEAAKDLILTNYLDTLSNLYNQYTHQVIENSYGIDVVVSPSGDEVDVVARAKNLFLGTSSDRAKELDEIAEEMGIEIPSGGTVATYAKELSDQMVAQYAGILELFELVGVVRSTTDATHMQLEGQMLYEQYPTQLEYNVIKLFLSRFADTSNITSLQSAAYVQFKEGLVAYAHNLGVDPIGQDGDGNIADEDYVLLLLTLSVDITSELEDGWSYSTSSSYSYSGDSEDEVAIITYLGTNYTAIANLLESRYDSWKTDDTSWDDYMTEMLFVVSPYNAMTAAADAFEELCQLTDLNNISVSDSDAFYTAVAGLSSTYGLEELIVDYSISQSAYSGTNTEISYLNYQDMVFTSDDEKEAYFLASSFYAATIGVYRAAYEETDEAVSTSWDEKMESILQLIAGGIITDSPSYTSFTN